MDQRYKAKKICRGCSTSSCDNAFSTINIQNDMKKFFSWIERDLKTNTFENNRRENWSKKIC